MSEEHTDNLKKARARLIEQRRAFVKVLAGPYERGRTEQARERFLDMQTAIEAMNRAIVACRPALARLKRSADGGATKQEDHRSPRSGRGGRRRRWDRAQLPFLQIEFAIRCPNQL
jgi:hypothetical protein